MKRTRNHHIDHDEDQADSIHAELRGAYERGRRDQRNTRQSPRRGSPMLLLLMGGALIAGAWMVLGTLNQQSQMPGMTSTGSSSAVASETSEPQAGESRAVEGNWSAASH